MWSPKNKSDLIEDVKFSQKFIKTTEFLDNLDLVKFVNNWEEFLFNNCYFDNKKESWFIDLNNETLNISNYYKLTFKVYKFAKSLLIACNCYTPYYYGFDQVAQNKGYRENE